MYFLMDVPAIQISVIIPIYNAGKYLNACLESLCLQTFQDYEVWLVDDGSKDGSSDICDVFVQKDVRFHVLHKENGGVSSARNAGLEQANGKWICFVDSDDVVTADYLQNLYNAAQNETVGLVIQGFSMVYSDGRCIDREFQNKTYKIDTIYKVFGDVNLNRCGFPFAKLFKNALIQKYQIRFDPAINYWEDKMFLWEYLQHIACIKTVSGLNYRYFIRNNAGNLSSRIFSFESEYRCYQMYYNLTRLLIVRFNLTSDIQKGINCTISESLIRRAIGSLYQRSTRKKQIERIAILKSITDDQIRFCWEYYKPCSWFLRLTVYLLDKKCYYLCDYLNQVIALGRKVKYRD